jgi:hypothetical protein
VSKDAPRSTMSFIRNWPAGDNFGSPPFSCRASGVVARKLRVVANIATPARLASADTLGATGFAAISAPIAISVLPISVSD